MEQLDEKSKVFCFNYSKDGPWGNMFFVLYSYTHVPLILQV